MTINYRTDDGEFAVTTIAEAVGAAHQVFKVVAWLDEMGRMVISFPSVSELVHFPAGAKAELSFAGGPNASPSVLKLDMVRKLAPESR